MPAPILPIRIINPKNQEVYSTFALLDTGAVYTAIPGFIAEDLGHDIKKVKPKEVYGITGKTLSYPHSFIIEVLSQNPEATNSATECKLVHRMRKKVEVMENLGITVLGAWDFMHKYIITVNYPGLDFSVKSPNVKKP